MPSLRSALKQSPAIAISAVALVFAVGTGASFAATSAPSAPSAKAVHAAGTILHWHRLPLGKGWQGSLKYAVSNGVVYLSGNAGKSGNTSTMTTLPPGARPTSSQQDIPIAVGAGAGSGIIQLLNDGTIFPFDSGNDYTFVSLSGVSFGLGS
jgi:hypothetical protein